MLRQASSRNQRAKGFRLKHALQLGILVAICIWLLYQVKHSHEKKRAYDAHYSKLITKAIENQEDFFDFGRKDLTRTEAGSVKEFQPEEDSEEVQEEEEPEVKQEETEDEEARGAGDDEIGQQDQVIADEETEETDRVEDSTEEEKEGQMEETDALDSQDNEGGTQAREENYKRDDVSSAVVHDTHAKESETVTVNARSTDEEQIVDGSKGDDVSANDGSKVEVAGDNIEKQEMETETNNVVNGTGYGSKDDNGTISGSLNNPSDVKDNGIMPDDNLANNVTAADSKEEEAGTSIPEDKLVSNSTIVEDKVQTDRLMNTTTSAESNNQTELSANSIASVSVNQTEGKSNSTVDELPSEMQTSNSTVNSDSAQNQNTTADDGAGGGDEPNLENVVSHDEKSNSTIALEVTGDLSRAVVKEDIETRTDLATLPNIENEAEIMDEAAAAK